MAVTVYLRSHNKDSCAAMAAAAKAVLFKICTTRQFSISPSEALLAKSAFWLRSFSKNSRQTPGKASVDATVGTDTMSGTIRIPRDQQCFLARGSRAHVAVCGRTDSPPTGCRSRESGASSRLLRSGLASQTVNRFYAA